MKIFYNLIALSLAIITTSNFKVFAQESVAHVKADWKVADWQSNEFKTDNDTKVIYAVRNDARGIHLLIKGGDRMLQAKILMGGMQIMLDPSGKKSKSIGINYPLPGKFDMRQFRGGQRPSDSTIRQRMADTSRRQRPDSARRGGRFDMKKMQEQTLAQKKEIELYGFTDENNGLSLVGESPVKVAIGYDTNDSLVYEINFPYNIFTKAPVAGDKLSIGFVVRGMQMPEFGGGDREGGGERTGGGGGFGGMPPGAMMMGGGGGTGGGQMDFMKIFEDNSFWIKHTLTTY